MELASAQVTVESTEQGKAMGQPLRRVDVGAGHALWSLNPYDAAGRPHPQALAALKTLLREGGTGTRRVVIGLDGEAWGPAEERCRLTRGLLELMALHGGVDLQIHTRTSLVARDADLLRRLSTVGRVTVAFTLASLDERVNRWLEPGAPSALRRLMAMQALAHTGVVVGLRLSPLLPSMTGEALAALLERAAHAGARFVELGEVGLTPALAKGLRARAEAGAGLPRGLKRLTFRKGELEALRATWVERCLAVGLLPLDSEPETVSGPVPAAPVVEVATAAGAPVPSAPFNEDCGKPRTVRARVSPALRRERADASLQLTLFAD